MVWRRPRRLRNYALGLGANAAGVGDKSATKPNRNVDDVSRQEKLAPTESIYDGADGTLADPASAIVRCVLSVRQRMLLTGEDLKTHFEQNPQRATLFILHSQPIRHLVQIETTRQEMSLLFPRCCCSIRPPLAPHCRAFDMALTTGRCSYGITSSKKHRP